MLSVASGQSLSGTSSDAKKVNSRRTGFHGISTWAFVNCLMNVIIMSVSTLTSGTASQTQTPKYRHCTYIFKNIVCLLWFIKAIFEVRGPNTHSHSQRHLFIKFHQAHCVVYITAVSYSWVAGDVIVWAFLYYVSFRLALSYRPHWALHVYLRVEGVMCPRCNCRECRYDLSPSRVVCCTSEEFLSTSPTPRFFNSVCPLVASPTSSCRRKRTRSLLLLIITKGESVDLSRCALYPFLLFLLHSCSVIIHVSVRTADLT